MAYERAPAICGNLRWSNTTQSALKIYAAAQWRPLVQSPIAPSGASEAVLKEHADDRHHCQAPVRQLCLQLLFPDRWVLDRGADAQRTQAQEALAIVTWFGVVLVVHKL